MGFPPHPTPVVPERRDFCVGRNDAEHGAAVVPVDTGDVLRGTIGDFAPARTANI